MGDVQRILEDRDPAPLCENFPSIMENFSSIRIRCQNNPAQSSLSPEHGILSENPYIPVSTFLLMR